jgi:hypothetical protein
VEFLLSVAELKIRKFTLKQLFAKLASGFTVRVEELIVARMVKNFSAFCDPKKIINFSQELVNVEVLPNKWVG